jgi:hypothetical protein
MADDDAWEARAKRLLRSEMTRRGVTYEQLAEKLGAVGIAEDHRNLRNKVARGKFSAALLLQCLEAMGAKELRLD